MNVLIVYKSKHNTTKKYSEWIHNEVKSDIINLDNISSVNLDNYGIIVFGSWIYDDIIVASDYIKNNWKVLDTKKIIVFANGLTNPDDEKMIKIFNDSFPAHIRNQIHFFPVGGKLSFSNTTLFDKIILRFKKKYRETNEVDERFVRPIVVMIYNLKMNLN